MGLPGTGEMKVSRPKDGCNMYILLGSATLLEDDRDVSSSPFWPRYRL